jgi:hypothetical protein
MARQLHLVVLRPARLSHLPLLSLRRPGILPALHPIRRTQCDPAGEAPSGGGYHKSLTRPVEMFCHEEPFGPIWQRYDVAKRSRGLISWRPPNDTDDSDLNLTNGHPQNRAIGKKCKADGYEYQKRPARQDGGK